MKRTQYIATEFNVWKISVILFFTNTLFYQASSVPKIHLNRWLHVYSRRSNYDLARLLKLSSSSPNAAANAKKKHSHNSPFKRVSSRNSAHTDVLQQQQQARSTLPVRIRFTNPIYGAADSENGENRIVSGTDVSCSPPLAAADAFFTHLWSRHPRASSVRRASFDRNWRLIHPPGCAHQAFFVWSAIFFCYMYSGESGSAVRLDEQESRTYVTFQSCTEKIASICRSALGYYRVQWRIKVDDVQKGFIVLDFFVQASVYCY